RRWLITVLVLIAVAGLALALRSSRRSAAAKSGLHRADVAWTALARCLIGAPLRAKERPTVRLRRIERAQASAAGDPASAWPRPCAPYAAKLRDAVNGAVDAAPRLERLQLY